MHGEFPSLVGLVAATALVGGVGRSFEGDRQRLIPLSLTVFIRCRNNGAERM